MMSFLISKLAGVDTVWISGTTKEDEKCVCHSIQDEVQRYMDFYQLLLENGKQFGNGQNATALEPFYMFECDLSYIGQNVH